MNEAPIHIRPAVATDVEAIARIHVASWRNAYSGQIPDAVLDSLDEQRRAALWRGLLDKPEHRLSLAELGAHLVGFCSVIRSRDSDAQSDVAEVAAIYVEPAHWRRGIGAALMDTALSQARADGFNRVTLWVLASNARAQRFYERSGFKADGMTKVEERQGYSLSELRLLNELT